MLLIDLTHTAHTAASTGIQQVCRNLYVELGQLTRTEAIIHDPFQCSWRVVTDFERERLQPDRDGAPARRKGEAWTAGEKIRGRIRMFRRVPSDVPPTAAILFPEFSLQRCLDAVPQLRQQTQAPFLAVYHDAIAMKLPALSAYKTVQRYPHYLDSLRRMDGIAAVSQASRDELLDYWAWCGVEKHPPVTAIPLGITPPKLGSPPARPNARPVLLSVGTLETRKNHIALLTAAESLWRDGLEFDLELIGMAHREMGKPIVARIKALEAAGRPIRWLGSVDETTLRARYAACDVSVYVSLLEGFGLPVLESLAYGKPCVCTTRGGLDEVSQGGGCLRLSDPSAPSVEAGLRRVITDSTYRSQLVEEARARSIRDWAAYAKELMTWVSGFAPGLR